MYLILGIYVIFVGFLIATEYVEKLKKFHLLFKILSSATFIVMAIYLIITNFEFFSAGCLDSSYAISIFISLLLCFTGDVFLSAVKGDSSKIGFTFGVAFFMLAHVAFLIAFSFLSPIRFIDFVVVAIVASLVFSLSKLKVLNLKGMIPILLVYSICLGFLTSKGITMVFEQGFTILTTQILAGCLTFLVSDIILIFELFAVNKHKILTFFNLITYYAAVMTLVLTIT